MDRLLHVNQKYERLKVASPFSVKLLPKDLQQVALFLDVDGTLYEIENSPGLIKPCYRLQKKLHTIRNRLRGALGLISGRTLDDLDRLFDENKISFAGNHGAQLKDALQLKEHQGNTGNIKVIAYKIKELLNGQKNIEIENKGSNLTVHFRNSTIDRKEINKIIMELVKYEPKLTFLKGKEVLEVKPLSHNKGTAISYFMRTKPLQSGARFLSVMMLAMKMVLKLLTRKVAGQFVLEIIKEVKPTSFYLMLNPFTK